MPEVPDEDGVGLVGEVWMFRPAEIWLAGEGEMRAGVYGEIRRTGGVLLLQGVVTQPTVRVPAGWLLRAGCQGVESEAEPDELHRVLGVLVGQQAEGAAVAAARGPGEEVPEQRPSSGLGGLGTGPGQANLRQEVLTFEITQISTVTVAEKKNVKTKTGGIFLLTWR